MLTHIKKFRSYAQQQECGSCRNWLVKRPTAHLLAQNSCAVFEMRRDFKWRPNCLLQLFLTTLNGHFLMSLLIWEICAALHFSFFFFWVRHLNIALIILAMYVLEFVCLHGKRSTDFSGSYIAEFWDLSISQFWAELDNSQWYVRLCSHIGL